jgi:hypothetical protein
MKIKKGKKTLNWNGMERGTFELEVPELSIFSGNGG